MLKFFMLLALLTVLLGFFTFGCFINVKETYHEKKEISKKNKINIFKTFNDKKELKSFIEMIVMTIVFLLGFYFSFTSMIEDKAPSKWDSLTKEEKQWYKDNYGGGKLESYNKAIESYKNK